MQIKQSTGRLDIDLADFGRVSVTVADRNSSS